ncbi:MAG: 50S ribosomal protein L33 [Mycoplasmataceae bacterium]|nr:50S ribosomal protein L33 [Mycoplasmataceae bacterium]
MKRRKVILLCNICLSRNYSFLKSLNVDKKLEINKYCSTCNKHIIHEETR